jgi:hypothetical protein
VTVPAPKPAGYSKRSRLDKLGVKAGMRVAVLGVADPGFIHELETRTSDLSFTRARKDSAMVILLAESEAGLGRLAAAARAIRRDGAVWVVWPKGQPHLREGTVRAAALAHGLVDVKVMAFDERLSALKLVVPVKDR